MAVVLQASGEAIGTVVDLYDGTGARGALCMLGGLLLTAALISHMLRG